MALNLDPNIIREIILRARAFQVKELATFTDAPGQIPQGYDNLQFLADHGNDLTYQEVVRIINRLEPDQQITLIVMLYIGRGDYSLAEWDEAWKEASYHWREHTGQYLLRHPQVADHLEEALDLLGYETGLQIR